MTLVSRILAGGIAAASAGAASLALIAPAQAADYRDAYASAIERSVTRADVPSSLGTFRPNPDSILSPARGRLFLCAGPESVPNGITVPGGKYRFATTFTPVDEKNGTFVSVTVNEYATPTDAIRAFRQAERRLASCARTTSNSWTDPDSNVTTTFSTTATVGKVPSVTIVGVESLFVDTNSTSTGGGNDAPDAEDQYQVISLVNDAIIITTGDSGSFSNLAPSFKRGVEKLAFAATGRWVTG